jgi:hypothetical protein
MEHQQENVMPHYADGTEAQLGDNVKGKPYNTPHEVTGVVVGLVQGSESCNLRVAFTRPFHRTKDFGIGDERGVYIKGYDPVMAGVSVTIEVDYGETKAFTLIARAEDSSLREQLMDEMVTRFLAWPLPASVCADLCATKRDYPHRTGTTLLTATEARQMLEHVLAITARTPPGDPLGPTEDPATASEVHAALNTPLRPPGPLGPPQPKYDRNNPRPVA